MGRIIQQPDLITDKGLIMAKTSKRQLKSHAGKKIKINGNTCKGQS